MIQQAIDQKICEKEELLVSMEEQKKLLLIIKASHNEVSF